MENSLSEARVTPDDFAETTSGHVNRSFLANWTNRRNEAGENLWLTDLSVPLAGKRRPYTGLHLLEATIRSDLMKAGFTTQGAREVLEMRFMNRVEDSVGGWVADRVSEGLRSAPEFAPNGPQTWWAIYTEFRGFNQRRPLIAVVAVVPQKGTVTIQSMMRSAISDHRPNFAGLYDVSAAVRRVYSRINKNDWDRHDHD